MSDRAFTNKIEIALGNRYAAPEWAFLTQVRNGTGFRNTVRTADALAMSLYPSRGIHLHGFEIKASKSDWTRELKNPEKAEEIARYCNFWWIAAMEHVVPLGDLPVNWGLLELTKGKLVVVKQPVFREADPLTTAMLASMFRNVSTSTIPAARVKQDIDIAVKEAMERQRSSDKYQIEDLRKQVEKYREFERLSRVRVDQWNLGDVSKAVRLIRSGDLNLDRYQEELSRIQRVLRSLGDDVARALDDLPGTMESIEEDIAS